MAAFEADSPRIPGDWIVGEVKPDLELVALERNCIWRE